VGGKSVHDWTIDHGPQTMDDTHLWSIVHRSWSFL
jgi:hypothetical protein